MIHRNTTLLVAAITAAAALIGVAFAIPQQVMAGGSGHRHHNNNNNHNGNSIRVNRAVNQGNDNSVTGVTPPTATATATRTAVGTVANAIDTPLVSTRANFDTSTSLLVPNHDKKDYAATDVPGLQVGTCPADIVIFVHGVGATQSSC